MLAEDDEGESMGYDFFLYDNEENSKAAIEKNLNQEWKGKKLFVYQFQKN